MRVIIIESCVQLPCALCYILFKYTETLQYIVCQEIPTNAFVGRQSYDGSAQSRGARSRTGGPSSGAEPTQAGHAFDWLHDHGTLVFAPAFCQRTSYLPEGHVMWTREERGSKAGEPKWPGCPPHLVSESTTPGAAAKAAASHWGLQPGIEKRCRSRSGCGNTAACSLPPSTGGFGVGTCGSRAAGAAAGAKLSILICLCL